MKVVHRSGGAMTSSFCGYGAIVQAVRVMNSFEIVAPGLGSGWGPEIATGVPRRLEAQPWEIRQLGSPSVDSPPYSGPQTRTREVASCRPVSFAFQRCYLCSGPLTGDGALRTAKRLLVVLTAPISSLNLVTRCVASFSNRVSYSRDANRVSN